MVRTKATAGFVTFPNMRKYKSHEVLHDRSTRARSKNENEHENEEQKETETQKWTKVMHTQASCPLFMKLPREIRSMIYEYVYSEETGGFMVYLRSPSSATSPSEPAAATTSRRGYDYDSSENDEEEEEEGGSEEWEEIPITLTNTPIFRPPIVPGATSKPNISSNTSNLSLSRQRPRISTAFLRTCQLVHLESSLLPVSVNTHVLTYPLSRALSFPLPTIAQTYFAAISPSYIPSVRSIHVFTTSSRVRTWHSPSRMSGGYRSESALAELALFKAGINPRAGVPLFPDVFRLTIDLGRDWHGGRFHQGGKRCSLDMMLRNQRWGNLFGGVIKEGSVEGEDGIEAVYDEQHGPVRKLVIEVEAELGDREKVLKGAVAELRGYEFDIGHGWALVGDGVVREGRWTRTCDRDGSSLDRLDVVVFIMQWTLQRKTSKSSKKQEQQT